LQKNLPVYNHFNYESSKRAELHVIHHKRVYYFGCNFVEERSQYANTSVTL